MKTNASLLFVSLLLVATLVSFGNKNTQINTDKFIVVIDAGHGGKDPGKPSKYGYTEKDIALKIALKVGQQLEKNKSIKVIYTRKTDVFIELRDRPKIANKAKADLFVSIHCNAHHTQAYGTETYVLDVGNTNRNFEVAKAENSVIFFEEDYEKNYGGFDPNSPESLITSTLAVEEYTDQSIALASIIEDNFSSKLKRKSRGVKQASLWVIHQTAMPSVLIETGFVTNKSEGAYLNSKKGQNDIASAITKAILEYKSTIDNNIGDFNFDEVSVKVNEEESRPITNDNLETITFKVQIAAGTTALETTPSNFKGLNAISRIKEGKMYKYFYGKTSNYNDINKFIQDAKNKGYKHSFVVAFKGTEKISLSEALKTTSN